MMWPCNTAAMLWGLADSVLAPYMDFNSGAFGSKPNAPPILNTGRAPVFLCLMKPDWIL